MNLPFNYADELTNRVKQNWLTLENKDLFEKCKNNNDFCIAFARLSIERNCERMLGDKIIEIYIKEMI